MAAVNHVLGISVSLSEGILTISFDAVGTKDFCQLGGYRAEQVKIRALHWRLFVHMPVLVKSGAD